MKDRFILTDNGGITADRYSIYDTRSYQIPELSHTFYIQYAGFSEDPYHPQGFGQGGEMTLSQWEQNKGNILSGHKIIALDDLPPKARRFAEEFMKEE